MQATRPDLSVLARTSPADRGGTGAFVPRPPSYWRTRVLLPGLLLAAFILIAGYAARNVLWRGPDVLVVPVVVKQSQETGGGMLFQAPGWVEADPFIVSVSALTDGVVQELLVLEGDPVKAGQTVARMNPDDARLALDRIEAEFQQRCAAVASAKASLAAAQRDWDFPIEQTRAVATAQSLLEGAQAELGKLEADIRIESARLDLIQEQLRRELDVSREAIPAFQIAKTTLEAKTQEAQLASVRARKPILEARSRELEAELTAAREKLRLRIVERKELDEAQARLTSAEAAQAEAQAKRNEAQLRLRRMDVLAPADGIVLTRLINPGDKLTLNSDSRHSAHVAQLYNPEKLQVRVDVPLGDAAKLSVGLQTKVVVDVLPEVVFEGVVTRVVHEADIQKNTLQVKVAIHAPVPQLKPEMLARVTFLEPVKKVAGAAIQRLFVPRNVVAGSGADTSVWIVHAADETAHRRPVKLGKEQIDGWVLVESGLQPGDKIISGDTAGLTDGDRVHILGEAR